MSYQVRSNPRDKQDEVRSFSLSHHYKSWNKMTYAQHFLREPFPLLPDDSRFESQPGLQVLWCPGRKYFYLLCLFFYILSIVLRLFPLVYFDIKNFFLLKCCSYGLRLIEVSNLFPNRPNSLETSLLKATYGSSHKDHCTPEETHSSWAGLCSFPEESTWAAQGEAGERHHAHPSRSAHNYTSNSFWFFLPEPNPK